METIVCPLGTASAMPAGGRHLPATAVERKGRVLLFDCGEGTQFQFLHAGLNRNRVDAIFLSHLHGDHCYGIFGLLSTLGQLGRTKPVTLVAPARFASAFRQVPGFENEWLPYEIEYVALEAGMKMDCVYETDEFTVSASELDHRVLSFGFRMQEHPRAGRLDPERARALGADPVQHFRSLKAGEPVTLADGSVIQPEEVLGPERPGVTFSYVSDTRPCEAAIRLGHQADLLYHEATFTEALKDRAAETGHSTALEAGRVASEASTRKLLISHFSARHDDATELVEEARRAFQNTEAAQELNRYVLDPREKWAT